MIFMILPMNDWIFAIKKSEKSFVELKIMPNFALAKRKQAVKPGGIAQLVRASDS